MAEILKQISKTLNEFLFVPRFVNRKCSVHNISIVSSITKHSLNKMDKSHIDLNVPIVAAAMQSVSSAKLAIALALEGGLAFISASQSISEQLNLISKVKNYRKGFSIIEHCLDREGTVGDALELIQYSEEATIAITDGGSKDDKLVGIIFDAKLKLSKIQPSNSILEYIIPISHMVTANIHESESLLIKKVAMNNYGIVPIVDSLNRLQYIFDLKCYNNFDKFTNKSIDSQNRLLVGAAINTWDYKERVPALIERGVDVIFVDSMNGFSEFQGEVIHYVKKKFGVHVKIGGGNVVDENGFNYLAKAGVDFIKVGMCGGVITPEKEAYGVGMGQASALLNVTSAREKYLNETGEYIPICSDGYICNDYQIVLALALGADFVMMGRYFASLDESPGIIFKIGSDFYKEHWGECARVNSIIKRKDCEILEEGIDSLIPYTGKLQDKLKKTIMKVKQIMSHCGVENIEQLHKDAVIIEISSSSVDINRVNNSIKKIIRINELIKNS